MTDVFTVLPDPLLADLADWLLTYLLHSTLLLGGAWVATRNWSFSIEVRETIWKIALVGGIATSVLQSTLLTPITPAFGPELSTLTSGQGAPAREQVVSTIRRGYTSTVPRRYAELPASEQPGPVGEMPGFGSAADSPAAGTGEARTEESPVLPFRTGAIVLLGIWSVGILVLGIRKLLGYRRLRRRLRRRTLPRDPSLIRLFRRTLDSARTDGSPVLTVCIGLSGPMALGANEICLPRWAVRTWSSDQIRSVLIHEVAHLERRDPWWIVATTAIETVFFLQPLNRLASDRLEHLFELHCDRAAVRFVGRPTPLATVLLQVARRSVRPAVPAGIVQMARTDSGLGDRIRRLPDGEPIEPTGTGPLLATVAAFSGLVLVACAGPRVQTNGSDSEGPPASSVPTFVEATVDTPAHSDPIGPESAPPQMDHAPESQPADPAEPKVTPEARPSRPDSIEALRREIQRLRRRMLAMTDSLQRLVRDRELKVIRRMQPPTPPPSFFDSLQSHLPPPVPDTLRGMLPHGFPDSLAPRLPPGFPDSIAIDENEWREHLEHLHEHRRKMQRRWQERLERRLDSLRREKFVPNDAR